jgi:hypothetical protein
VGTGRIQVRAGPAGLVPEVVLLVPAVRVGPVERRVMAIRPVVLLVAVGTARRDLRLLVTH